MINIVLATDANNLWGVAVTVRSVLESCSTICNVYVICVDVKLSDHELLHDSWRTPNIGEIEFISFDKTKLAHFRSTLYLKSKVSNARLFIADCLPNLSRCIYLDTDLIAFSDLKTLYNTDLLGNIAGCVLDSAASDPNQAVRLKDDLKLRSPSLYFNAGVILIDLVAWRRNQVTQKTVQVSTEMYDVLAALDQDILNIVLQDHWLSLDPKWNTLKFLAPGNFSDGIVHLCGRVKPWHPDYQDKFKDEFFEILDRTKFSGKRPSSLMGLGTLYKKISRSVPTLEMIQGKLRRFYSNI
ncbi:MAG: glycosyltransferase family 8 protein [Phormidesmis sp. CAN_BIN44]|nr:glycosyltransferase family 8 protein [Phormidesmis sp. CAN_BIN44]